MSAEPTLASLLFEEDKLSTEAALEVVDELMVALGGKVDDIYLGTLDIAYATELAMLKMKKVLDWAVLDHDGVYADEEPLEEFSLDAEPLPSKIDSWARGTGKLNASAYRIYATPAPRTLLLYSSYSLRTSCATRTTLRLLVHISAFNH
jgi:hypothetical protein